MTHTADKVPGKAPGWNGHAPVPTTGGAAPYRSYNLGNEHPGELLRYIEVLEQCLRKKVITEILPLQAGDVTDTEADDVSERGAPGQPSTHVEDGMGVFVQWYRDYCKGSA